MYLWKRHASVIHVVVYWQNIVHSEVSHLAAVSPFRNSGSSEPKIDPPASIYMAHITPLISDLSTHELLMAHVRLTMNSPG